MPFLYKDSAINKTTPFYTLGLFKSVLVVGLGNVGKEYENTRHNIGFVCLDQFRESSGMEAWTEQKKLSCFITNNRQGDTQVIAIKPTTFMNNSGEAVKKAMAYYKLSSEDLIVVHDELDIPFGQIRTKTGGSSAGHNGLKSIIEQVGEDFARVRIGIGPKTPEQIDSGDFVLGKFPKEQVDELKLLTSEVTAIITEFIYNKKLPSETRSFIL